MKNIEIITRYKDLVLLKKNVKTPEPFIVAERFDDENETWACGHYFADLDSAQDAFNSKVVDILVDLQNIADGQFASGVREFANQAAKFHERMMHSSELGSETHGYHEGYREGVLQILYAMEDILSERRNGE